MAEKFDIKKEIGKLNVIYSSTKPAKEEFKQAIINNLPRVSNPATKDFMEHLGLGDNKDILPGQIRKEKKIETYVGRKENSIVEAAIRRDAALFAVSEMGALPKSENAEKRLVELHNKWLTYFEVQYKGEQNNGN